MQSVIKPQGVGELNITDQVFTREALYGLVWSEAMTKLAKRLGVLDVGLAEACHKAGVPIPERGYWSKLRHGKPVHQPPLPERPDIEKVVLAQAKCRPKPDPPEPAALAPIGAIAASRRNPHPMVRGWVDAHDQARRDARQGGWSVAPEGFDSPLSNRRLRLYSSLFKTLEAQGFQLENASGPTHWVSARKSGQVQEFRINERSRVTRRQATAEELRWRPDRRVVRATERTGGLVLRLRTWPNYGRDFRDGKAPLEEQLDAAARLIEAGIAKQLERKRDEAENHQRWEAAQALRHRREAQRAAQEACRTRLFTEVEHWRAAASLRAMVAAAEVLSLADDARFAAWRSWALKEAEEIDPVGSGRLGLSGLPPSEENLEG